jgi:hypothetical protein
MSSAALDVCTQSGKKSQGDNVCLIVDICARSPRDLAKSDSEMQRFESVSNPCLIASPPRSNLLAQLSVLQLGPNNL